MITEAMHVAGKNMQEIQARIDRIFEAQSKHRWGVAATDADARIRKLKRLLDAIQAWTPRIHAALKADFRKPEPETDLSEIYPVLTEIRHAMAHLHRWMHPEKVPNTMAFLTTSAWIKWEPKGVVLIMAPWNYPFNLCVGPLISAIAAGNCAMIKPSEYTPNTSKLIREMLAEIFDENEVAVFEGDADVAQALLQKPFHHIFFTGSPHVGKLVMKAAAEHLSTVTLELGGKSPAIVDETANLKDAAQKIIYGKFINNGQTCIAPDYLLLHEKIHNAFLAECKAVIQKLWGQTEDDRRNSPDYARIISDKHHARLKGLFEGALKAGATVEIGGKLEDSERYFAPTILSDVDWNNPIMQEEIFGPILPALKYHNLEEAIHAINEREKPLALYVFSRKRDNIQRVMTFTSSGSACINEAVLQFLHPNLPFGGVNFSGVGNAHGRHGFRAFSHERSVLKHHALSPLKMMFPPYTDFVKRLISLLKRFF